jgi:hypothetical protein
VLRSIPWQEVAEGFPRKSRAEQEVREELATAEVEEGEDGWSLSVGSKSGGCIMPLWSVKNGSGKPS